MIEEHDTGVLRALAAAVLENAIACACSTSRTWTDADRADALAFLLDAGDPRLDRWCAVLDLDADAMRSRLRHRLGSRDAA